MDCSSGFVSLDIDKATFLRSYLGQIFFISWLTGIFFTDLGSGGRKKKKKSSENDQLTGHFQSFFFFFFFFFFNIFNFFISPETVKLVIGKPTVCIKSLNILSFS